MKLLTKDQQESNQNAKFCYICKEKFENKHLKDKYRKFNDHCPYTGEYRNAAHGIYNLKYSVPKKMLQLFTMDLTMIITLSKKSQQKNIKNSLLCQEKTLKNT